MPNGGLTDQIDDASFVSGIQYLINQGIMKIPETAQGSGSGSDGIPEWIKGNAEWWAAGQIDDNTFVSGIQVVNFKWNYENILNWN